jgi:hypothetical protein
MDHTRLQKLKTREKKLVSKRKQRLDPNFREMENKKRRLRRQEQKQVLFFSILL